MFSSGAGEEEYTNKDILKLSQGVNIRDARERLGLGLPRLSHLFIHDIHWHAFLANLVTHAWVIAFLEF